MEIEILRYFRRSWKSMMFRIVALLFVQAVGAQAFAQSSSGVDTFPRLGGYQIGGWAYGNYPPRLDKIANLDIAVIGLFVGHNVDGYSIADITGYLKSKNPDLRLLEYVIVNEIPQGGARMQEARDKISREKGPGGSGDWYARNAAGEIVNDWPGTYMLNLTDYVTPDANGERLPTWLANWYSDQYFEVGGTWDGFFIDVMRVEPQQDPDWDGDGSNDSRSDPVVVDKYTAGQMEFYDRFIQRYPNFIGSGNISNWQVSTNPLPDRYDKTINGGLVEGLAGLSWSSETWGGFSKMMSWYRQGLDKTKDFVLFHVVGGETDYRFMRYTLAACLMDDGYYTHTTTSSYEEQAWFDEFDIELGTAIDPPQTTSWSNGVYRRNFQYGVVLVNPRGNGTQTVNVGSGLKKFLGTQDPAHNDGSGVATLTLAEGDGIILVSENVTEFVRTPNPPSWN
jgi:hypothetical protein